MRVLEVRPQDCDDETEKQIMAVISDDVGGGDIPGFANAWTTGFYKVWKFVEDGDQPLSVVAITGIMRKQLGNELFCLGVAGNGLLWHRKEFSDWIDSYAKEQGCKWISSLSRKYMARMMEGLGYKAQYLSMIKEL